MKIAQKYSTRVEPGIIASLPKPEKLVSKRRVNIAGTEFDVGISGEILKGSESLQKDPLKKLVDAIQAGAFEGISVVNINDQD